MLISRLALQNPRKYSSGSAFETRVIAPVERFTRELIPLVLSGPPTAPGYGEGRPQVREIVAYWPTLMPRNTVEMRVEVIA